MFHSRRWVVTLLVLVLAFTGIGNGLADASQPSPNPLEASAVYAIQNRVSFWNGALRCLTSPAPDGTVAVNIPGYVQTDTPGMPQLPLTSELVILPPGARPTLEIIQIEDANLLRPGPLQLSPRPAGVQREAEGNVIGGTLPKAQKNLPCLEAEGCPEEFEQPVTLTLLGTFRGVSLARLSFSPVRPVANRLRVTTHIQVVLKFNVNTSDDEALWQRPSGFVPLDPLLEVLKRSVINPEQLQPSPLSSTFAAQAAVSCTTSRVATCDPFSGAARPYHRFLCKPGRNRFPRRRQ